MMQPIGRRSPLLAGVSAAVLGLAVAGPAAAQQRPAAESTTLEEVVVTGTLIRGIAPPGAQVVGVSEQQVVATGALNATQVLQTIPQLGGFNSLDLIVENTQIAVKRPNVRNLPGQSTAGGSTTLVLVDGHRIVNAGIQQTAPDPDVVPPGVLERVEVIPDGGTATYGADAVGGVINFITRRRFDGVQIDARYGFADAYESKNLNLTVGEDWGPGSAYLSYSYAKHDALFGRDRDYVRHYGPTGGPAQDISCPIANVTVAGVVYGAPSLSPTSPNYCDTTKNATFYPAEELNSFFGGLSQDLTDNLKLDVRGFHSKRETVGNAGPFTTNGTITAANPFYRRTTANPAPQPPANQAVTFDWSPIFGNASRINRTELESWGLTPTLTFDLDDNWQFRLMTNYGRSRTIARNPTLNNTLVNQALAGTTTQTAINPYDIAATPNRSLFATFTNNQFYGEGRQELINHRIIADGKVLTLPGGDLRLAVGAEYLREGYRARSGDSIPGLESRLAWRGGSRNSTAAFAELFVPIVGPENRLPGVHALNVSLAGRYDDYSDFGDTANPKLSLTYEPVEWITVRGNWGKSFNSPSLADTVGAGGGVTVFPFVIIPSPLPGQFNPSQFTNVQIAIQGGVRDMQPQEATTYTVGFDVRPPVVPGLTLSATYFNIDFTNLIGSPPVFDAANFYRNYQPYYILSPTQQQVEALVQGIPGGANAIAGLFAPGARPVYGIIDFRRRNLGNARIAGLDFAVRYSRPTDFGSVDASVTGTYQLSRKEQPLEGLPFNNVVRNDLSRLRTVTIVGANIGALRAQAQWNHSSGFRTTASPLISRIGDFNVVNLFFSYGFERDDYLKDTQVTLTVNNVFDEDPPFYPGTYAASTNGYANGSTIGRFVQIGLNKKF